jgi:hypothetical protein
MHKWEEVFVLYDVGRLGVGSRTSGEREALKRKEILTPTRRRTRLRPRARLVTDLE